ncbi:MAG: TonB-dependent receptor [Acidobacteria bacterium]|nr:TonB-dependent receptor [Acidobacteriota bacterium]
MIRAAEKEAAGEESQEESVKDKKKKLPFREVVVVTANRIESPSSRVGSSVTVITREEMARRQHRFVLDALRDVAGVDIRRSGGPGQPASIFMRGTDSDHTLLLIDGVQVHDPGSPAGAAVLGNLLVDNIDRIEVVRGPQSTLYGSDAIGGVINIITRKGAGTPTFSFTAEGGAFGTKNGIFRSEGGNGKINYSFSATRFDSDGFSAASNNPEDDGYTNRTVAGRFGVETSDRFQIDFLFRVIDSRIDFDAFTDPDLPRTDADQSVFKVEPRWSAFRGRWQQKLGIWNHSIDRDNRGAIADFFPSAFRGRIFGVDWQHNLQLRDHNTMTLGLEFERQDGEGQVSLPFPPFNSGFAADQDSSAFYFQDYWEWKERFSSTIGFRVDDYDDFGTEATYRLAGSYELPGAATRFHASVGTGFKAPSLSERFDASFGSNNPALDPEESFGFDAGVSQAWRAGKISAGLTFFYNDIDDMIVFVGSVGKVVNIEKVRTQGVETSLEFRPNRNWISRLNYTYTDAEAVRAASFGITDGEQLLRRPKNKAGGSISYLFPGNAGQATLSLLYVGTRRDLDPLTFLTVTAEDYFVVNLAGSMRLNDAVDLFARIDNLFDEDYQEVLGFRSPDFSLFGGVTIAF